MHREKARSGEWRRACAGRGQRLERLELAQVPHAHAVVGAGRQEVSVLAEAQPTHRAAVPLEVCHVLRAKTGRTLSCASSSCRLNPACTQLHAQLGVSCTLGGSKQRCSAVPLCAPHTAGAARSAGGHCMLGETRPARVCSAAARATHDLNVPVSRGGASLAQNQLKQVQGAAPCWGCNAGKQAEARRKHIHLKT